MARERSQEISPNGESFLQANISDISYCIVTISEVACALFVQQQNHSEYTCILEGSVASLMLGEAVTEWSSSMTKQGM